MISRVLAAGLLAGLLAGLAIAVLQAFTTTPLILEAESFEGGHGHDHAQSLTAASALLQHAVLKTAANGAALIEIHSAEDAGMWMPEDGLERTVFTSIANVGTAIGFALVLLAGMLLAGDRITETTAIGWAAAGFVATGLSPSLGLSPELPGMPAADLVSRQAWWLATALCTAAALWLILRSEHGWAKALGVLVLLAPHIWGAPHLEGHAESAVPAHLAAQFTGASLAVHASLWALSGFFVGFWWRRLAPASA
ncbi:CbtA family protein [Methyloligella solikamskensis]|uniref:CbtA family protein n=1 Tax=Methyloligella solikamskensis TaxID=1177756 RepID=A0ABW3J8V3_9HYPH